MDNSRLFIIILLLYILTICNSGYQRITCRDPDNGGDIQNKDRKFLLLGININYIYLHITYASYTIIWIMLFSI